MLVTGPTGSGKTTTLYAALSEMNTPERKIITIEDPVEYELEGINQIQVNAEDRARPSPRGLRAMLRADPDMIMVGEIRDRETAADRDPGGADRPPRSLDPAHERRAARASRGCSTWASSRSSSPPASRASSPSGSLRRLCENCTQTDITADALPGNGFNRRRRAVHAATRPAGCVRCRQTGYRGRVGLYEMMEITDEIRELIVEKQSAEAIAAVAITQGMRRLRDDGLAKVRAGKTSMSELLRVLGTTA